MKIKPRILTLRELKILSYRMIKKYHQFERPGKTKRLYGQSKIGEDGRLYAIVCLENLIELFRHVLQPLDELELESAKYQLINRLQILTRDLNLSFETRRKLDSEFLALALTAHSEIFGRLLEERYDLDIKYAQWPDCTLPFVATWGNRI